MPFHKKIALALLVTIGAAFSLAMWGNLHVCKWKTETHQSAQRAYASPQTFGPSAYPEGDFVVAVEAPQGLRKALIRYLERELPKTTFGASRVIVVDDAASYVPGESGSAESNMLYVHVEASLIWTPLYARFADTTEVQFSNGYHPGWAGTSEDVIVITNREVRVKGSYSISGTGFGLIGRSYADTFHAEVLGNSIKQAIVNTYTQIRDSAARR